MAARKPRKTTKSKSKSKPSTKNSNRNIVLAFVLGVAAALALLFVAQNYLPSYKSLTGLLSDRQTSVSPAKPKPNAPAQQAQPAPQIAQEPAKPQVQPQSQAQPQPQAQAQTEPSAQEAQKPATEPSSQAQTGKPKVLLAIVIDDLGSNLSQAEALVELRMPLTGSVLPGLRHTRDVDALLAKSGVEVLLHQPMEAWNTSLRALGPGGLHVGMSAKDVAKIVENNLSQTPHAVGMNNHMGSRASEDEALMDAVMAVLKARGLFFLDSKTSDRSVAEKRAAKAKTPALARAVFLDNERGQQSAILMLKEAERVALMKGRAVAIGHPHPETLAALAAWDIRRDQRVRLVPLSRLLKAD